MKNNLLFKTFIYITTSILFFILFALFYNLFKEGLKVINWEFLFGSPKGTPPGIEGGIFPAIVGSFIVFFLSSFFASVLSIATAIYTTFYMKRKSIVRILNIVIASISGIPSIVLGLFGYTLFVYSFGFGRSVLSASLTLAIMIFPFIYVRVEKLFQNYEKEKIESALSLGMDLGFTIRHIVIKDLKSKILETVALSGSLAFGATAPIMLTGAALHASIPKSMFSSFMALPHHLYILINEGISIRMGYGTGVVLMVLLMLINFFVLALGGRDDNN